MQGIFNQAKNPHGEEIENPEEGGEHQDVPRHKAAQGGKAEEEQAEHGLRRKPDQQRVEIDRATQSLRPQSQEKDDHIGYHEEGGPRRRSGEKQALAPDWQRVDEGHRAVVIQIGPYGHSGDESKEHAHGQTVLRDAPQHRPVGKLPDILRAPGVSAVYNEVYRHVEKPHEGIHRPDGPKAGQMLTVQRKIKVRFRGRHSPH
ncbi:hypothetical protein SDC9_186644 [bioreactor metagenome]|uniref:Uncharacterized protein n=1 Tax=bioreactor metagenome TaxID=1076179 RepID=A0A645HJG5_9ZZZZ